MKLNLSQQMKLSQELRLTPMMIQSMEILQLQIMQLQARINQELEENPMLEISDDHQVDIPGTDSSREELGSDEAPRELTDGKEENFKELDDLEKSIADYDSKGKGVRPNVDASDAKHEAMQNTAAPQITLQDHLFNQIRMCKMSDHELQIAEHVIYNISNDGYLRAPLPDILLQLEEIMEDVPTREDLVEIIEFIQNSCEPDGVCARDLKECLLLQLRTIENVPDLVLTIVSEHLDDVMNNRLPQLAKKLNIDIDQIIEARKYLHILNPKPGLMFGDNEAKVVIPDIIIEQEDDGNFVVRIENSFVPELVISKEHREQLENKEYDKETSKYVKGKLDGARWLIDAIQQRQNTMLKITREIVVVQDQYLRNGIEYLQPLRMQEIADKVNVHVSTVSRAISGKYVQCPQGIFPMKNFFTGGSVNEDGVSESHQVIRNKVRDLINDEDKQSPLSDDEIVRKLKEQGVTLARRTVAKYRKIMNIPPARMRREY